MHALHSVCTVQTMNKPEWSSFFNFLYFDQYTWPIWTIKQFESIQAQEDMNNNSILCVLHARRT